MSKRIHMQVRPQGKPHADDWVENRRPTDGTQSRVKPKRLTIEIDHPDYEPWSQAGVTPGSKIRANLKGNAALRLDVVDGSGESVELYPSAELVAAGAQAREGTTRGDHQEPRVPRHAL